MLEITFLAVAKVIVAVCVGAYTCNSIPHTATSLRDFSFTISNLILPCLTISNTAKSVNVEVFVRCSILVLFAILLLVLASASAMIMSALLFRVKSTTSTGVPPNLRGDIRLELQYYDPVSDEEEERNNNSDSAPGQNSPQKRSNKKKDKSKRIPYVAVVVKDELFAKGLSGDEIIPLLEIPDPSLEDYPGHFWGALVGCTFQNTVTLPLSLIQSIMLSVDWIDLGAATAYIFLFGIPGTLYLWSVGPHYVARAQNETVKLTKVREILERHMKRMNQCDAQTQTEVRVDSVASPARRSISEFPSPSTNKDASASKPIIVKVVTQPTHASGLPVCETDSSSVGSESVSVSCSISYDTEVHKNSLSDEGPLGAMDNSDSLDEPKLSRAASQADLPCTAGELRKYFAPTKATADQFAYDWKTEGLIRIISESDFKMNNKDTKTLRERLEGVKALAIQLLTNIPLMAIVVGLAIGTIPPLRSLFFDNGPFVMVMDAVALVSQGCIPCSLLLLGANLMNSTKAPSSLKGAEKRSLEQNTDFPLHEQDLQLVGEDAAYATLYNEHHKDIEYQLNEYYEFTETVDDDSADVKNSSWMDGVNNALSLKGIKKSFIWGIIIFRLIITPAISFIILAYFCKFMPFLFGGKGNEDKTMMLVLFSEIAAPSAINSALLFNQRQFMTYKWAKMLFFQYVLCAFTLVTWSTLGLYFLQSNF